MLALLILAALGAAVVLVAVLTDGRKLVRTARGWVDWDEFLRHHAELF